MNGVPYLSDTGIFLVRTLFGILLFTVLLRFLLQWVRADFYNPLVQVLVKITNPLLVPLRRLIPGFWGLDLAAIVLLLGLKLIELIFVFASMGRGLGLPGILVLAVAELLELLVNVLFWAVIVRAVLSWVSPHQGHPVAELLYRLTEPLLRPVRNLLPPLSGLDLSPLVVLIAFGVLQRLLIAPLADLGMGLG
ncbi:MAG: YggT family protein [Gammaproteobacteria bacterium]